MNIYDILTIIVVIFFIYWVFKKRQLKKLYNSKTGSKSKWKLFAQSQQVVNQQQNILQSTDFKYKINKKLKSSHWYNSFTDETQQIDNNTTMSGQNYNNYMDNNNNTNNTFYPTQENIKNKFTPCYMNYQRMDTWYTPLKSCRKIKHVHFT